MNPWDFRSPKGKPHAAEDYEIPVIDFARSELAVIGVIGDEYQPVDIQLPENMVGFFDAVLAGPIGQHSGDIEVQAETDELLALEPAGMRHGNAQCGVVPDNIPDA